MTVDLRLALPAACAWIAAAVLIGMPQFALPALIVAWLAAGALALFRPQIALVLAAVALCCSSVALQQPARQHPALLEAAEHGRTLVLHATTTETIMPGQGSFEVSVTASTGHSTEAQLGAVPVFVFGEGPAQRVGIGSVVELTGTLTVAEPGDDRAFLLFPTGPPTLVANPPWYLDWANALRSSFLAATATLPGEGGDLLAGLAIGDTSAVADDLDTAMKSSSLSHLTAVSGANCAVVIGLIMLAGGALGLPRWARITASVVVLVAFVVLVTPEPSVLRAAVMAALVLVTLASGRPVRGLPVLAVATLGLLVIDPWLARNFGFVLSVLATGGLLLLAGPLAAAFARWMPRWLSLVIAVPLAAQLACQPVIILLNASIPTYGVVANVLAAPAAPVATVVGLAACILLVLVPPLGLLLCQLAWLPSAWIAAVAQFFAAAPGSQLPWPAGPLGVALLVMVGAVAVAALRFRWAVGVLGLGIVVYAGVIGGAHLAQQLGRPPDWQVAGCDVGQGDAFVVRSQGQVALIDTGPEPAPLTRCLDTLGISRIDLLVLTHFDLDHVGGVDAVVGRADRVLVGPSDGGAADRIVADLLAGGAAVQQASRGLDGDLGDYRWNVLWPPQRLPGIEPGNDASVTLEFEPVGQCASGCVSSLFLGDLGEQAQSRVAVAAVDIVKVAHHGSSDQSERLYERADAVVGLIGVGADNGYGHPTDRLLDMLARAGTTALRTDEDGLLLVSPGEAPGTVSVWTER